MSIETEREIDNLEGMIRKLTLRQDELKNQFSNLSNAISELSHDGGDMREENTDHLNEPSPIRKERDMTILENLALSRSRLKAMIRGLRSDLPYPRDTEIYKFGGSLIHLSACTERIRDTLYFVYRYATPQEHAVFMDVYNRVNDTTSDDNADGLYRAENSAPDILQWPASP